MCECYRIGGPFIAEDPDCPVHGWEAQQRDKWAAIEKEEVEKEHQDRYEEIMDTLHNLQRTISNMATKIAKLESVIGGSK